MRRDLGSLARHVFDVLVVGGGVCGLAAVYEAAQRGLRAALVERHDFGSGASFNHHKTLHGGIRYLPSLDLRQMRELACERRAFARIAPQLLAPQAFLVPTWPRLAQSATAMRAAFAADRAIEYDRNTGVPPSHYLPPARVLTLDEFLELAPQARGLPATGAALWHDYRADEGDRLTLAFGLAAARFGAVLANYADAIEPIRDGTRIAGMRVRDAASGDVFDVRARVTVNATGAGASRLMAAFGRPRGFPVLKAMNVVTTREASGPALALPSSDGRLLLLALPWRGRLTVGTSYATQISEPDDTRVTVAEVSAFLDEINETFPWLSLRIDEVSLVHRGMVPARQREGHPPAPTGRAEVCDHAAEGAEGAVSMIGVRYTTARLLAERTIDLVAAKLGTTIAPSRTAELPLLAPVRFDEPGRDRPADASPAERITRVYGATAARVLGLHAERPELGRPVGEGLAVTGAQVLEAIRHEMAQTLEDVVVRRTGLGALGCPDDTVVHGCAAVMQEELGWSGQRVAEEVARLRRFYLIASGNE